MVAREWLFLSYAWEDGALCEWLYRKLTAEGYLVWCDRFSMYGGEHWPKDIDVAIKTKTFRMLALLSRHSLPKENPVKERQMALALSKERREEFLIPLNVDGLRPTELGWELSDLNYISFGNWAAGLKRLLETLEKVGAPRPLPEEGPAIAARTFLPPPVVRDEPERLYTNCLVVKALPEIILRFEMSRPLFAVEWRDIETRWAVYRVDERRALAFGPPRAALIGDVSALRQGGAMWRPVPDVDGIRSGDLVSALIRKALVVRAVERGMQLAGDGQTLFFPAGLLPSDRLPFTNYKVRATWVRVVGERQAGLNRTRYHLGVHFRVRRDVVDGFTVQCQVRVHVTDVSGDPLNAKAVMRRRKLVAQNWWNHQWLSRQMAIAQFLAAGSDEIVVGDVEGQTVRIGAQLLAGQVPASIDDRALEPVREEVEALDLASAQESDEVADAPTGGSE